MLWVFGQIEGFLELSEDSDHVCFLMDYVFIEWDKSFYTLSKQI